MGTLFEVEGSGVTKGTISSVRNFGTTQWNQTLGATVNVSNGDSYNLFVDFDPVGDKDSAGTTTYDELDLAYGIDVTLAGNSGTANININGTNYLATFNTDLTTTASDFVTAHIVALNADNVRVLDNGSAVIRFCAPQAICDGITIANLTGNLTGVSANGFTGVVGVSAPDHIIIPYVGEPYENQHIQYNIRVNLNMDTGNTQTASLVLRRFEDDSTIGSAIPVIRNNDITGIQEVFITYVASATDPFVLGGFYFAFDNNAGVQLDLSGKLGILVQTYYQYPTHF